MSAYNNARYNLSRFNVNAGGAIWLEAESKAEFAFSFAGQTHVCRGNSVVSFIGEKLVLNRGRMAAGAGTEQFTADADVNGYFWLMTDHKTYVSGEINLSQDAYVIGTGSEVMEAEANLSQQVFVIGSDANTFDADVNLSQIVSLTQDIGEVFTATADITALTEYVCEFPGLTLKPGQTLIVDAGMYNILLDGENAVYLQRGEWLDSLSRNTQSITISANGASRITATILYTERFL